MINEATFYTERGFDATAAAVFEAFADAGKLAVWWGPDGFTNTFQSFEFRVGGSWKFTMHGPDGTDYRNENEFAALEPDRLVVIRHVSNPPFTLTVSIEDRAVGSRVRWTQKFDDANTALQVRHIVEPANEQNLDRLGRLLATDSEERYGERTENNAVSMV